MANFKVGQRVRIVNTELDAPIDRYLVGKETVTTSCRSEVDGRGYYRTAITDALQGSIYGVWEDKLEPILDADQGTHDAAFRFVRDVTQPNPGILRTRETAKVLK